WNARPERGRSRRGVPLAGRRLARDRAGLRGRDLQVAEARAGSRPVIATEAVSDPASLVGWDYWLNHWPDTPVVLTRANAADGYPKALTPLSQDLVLRFEEAGVRAFYFDTLKALRPGDCPTPFMQAYYGLVY